MKREITCIIGVVLAGPVLADNCDELSKLNVADTVIEKAEIIADGRYTPEGSEPITNLPEFCRLSAVLLPSDDSHIEMEIWLPEQNWNGKFLAVGNGGWAGSISYSAMADGLRRNYAVASNDTGHKEYSAAFAMGHPEKLVDFGYRAMHEMVVQSKKIIKNYYENAAQFSYFQGCSTGGRQGLMSAQRFPEDFDAIIAGAPVNNMFLVSASQMYSMVSMLEDQSLYLPENKIRLLHDAILKACEVNDRVQDGFLNNPETCNFDPSVLQCESGDSSSCLTPRQVESVRRAYSPVKLRTGEEVYPGHAPGFELDWRMMEAGTMPSTLQSDTFQYIVHESPEWDWHSFDLDIDTPLALQKAGSVHAVDPDLGEFKANGGKLIIYHGWNDPGPSPYNTINYYNNVLETMGTDQSDWMRVFMVPGMGHCRGGIGPDQADYLSAIEKWREGNIAPDKIIAESNSNTQPNMSRPLCPYPEEADWNGQGSTNEESSFTCLEK